LLLAARLSIICLLILALLLPAAGAGRLLAGSSRRATRHLPAVSRRGATAREALPIRLRPRARVAPAWPAGRLRSISFCNSCDS